MTLENKLNDVKKEELERIAKELEPHFNNYGEIDFDAYGIMLLTPSNKLLIIYCFPDGTFTNNYNKVYADTGLNKEDVFEEVGEKLKEIKIKPKSFNIETWKKEFAKRYNLCYSTFSKTVKLNDNLIISNHNNVNYKRWHEETLKSEKFKFSYGEAVPLKTYHDCIEFENVVKDYLKNKLKEDFKNITLAISNML